MRKTILEKALKTINARRYQVESDAVNNKIKAFENDDYKKLYQNYVNKMIENAKVGNEDDSEIEKLKVELEQKRKELNLPSVEPVYFCKKCNDNGFIEGKYCSCLINEINNILKSESGFDKLEDFDKSKFDLFENREFMEKLYKKMQEWCHSDFKYNLIYLGGQTGVGKTHLMKCMANELIKENKVVMLTTSFAMNQDFLKSYSCRDLEEKDLILDKYLNAEVLFIDDLGTELRQPNITVSYLYLILNERKINKLPTIITSNLALNDIMDYYDERVSSRIIDKTNSICVYIEGNDVRLKK